MSYKGEPASIFAILFFLLIFPNALGQELPDSIQELEEKIGTITSDHELLKIYGRLANKLIAVDPEKGVFYSTEAIDLADKLDDINAYARACISMSINLVNIGKPDSALYFSRKVLKLDEEGEIEGFEFYAINSLGHAHKNLGNNDSAFYYYNLLLELAKISNKQDELAAAYNNIGLLLIDQGELEKSYESYLRALKILEQLQDEENISTTLNNIAIVNQENKEYRKSIEYLDRAAEINERNNFNQGLSMNYSNLGIAYKNLESYDTSLYYYEKSIQINQAYGFEQNFARDYFNVGNLYLEKGDYDNARKYLEKSLAESEKNEVKIGELYNHLQLAEIDIIQGKLEIAETRLKQIDRLIQETGRVTLKENALHRKSSYYEKKGDLKNALNYYRQYHDFMDSLQKLSYKENIAEMQEKYESEKKGMENQQLKNQILLNKKVIQNQYLFNLLIAISLVSVLIILVISFRTGKKLKRANNSLQELNQQVIQQKNQLEASNNSKDKLFSIIAHDLRSPFNSLMGFLDILINEFDELDDPEKMKMLNIVNNQSVITYGILENLLEWSLMQRGMLQAEMESVNLFNIVQSQFYNLQSRANAKALSLENNLPASFTEVVDENMIRTVFRNLINNAIKFTPRGGVISVSLHRERPQPIIVVADNGVGIKKEHVNNLFSNKLNFSESGTENESGSGLGLAIVKEFCEKMNISISVESAQDKGTKFYLSFVNSDKSTSS